MDPLMGKGIDYINTHTYSTYMYMYISQQDFFAVFEKAAFYINKVV